MKTHKNIDRLFQEKLKDLEVSPPIESWNNIEKEIHGSTKKLLIPYWLKLGSVAALLLFFSVMGINYFNSTTNIEEPNPIVTDTDKIEVPTTISPSDEESSKGNDEINTLEETVIVEVESSKKSDEKIKSLIPINSKNGNINSDVNRQISSTTPNDYQTTSKDELNNSQKKASTKEDLVNLEKMNSNSGLNTVAENSKKSKKESVEEVDLKDELVEKEIEEDIANIEEGLNSKKIEEAEDLLKKEKNEEVSNRWSVATIFGPVFYDSFTAENSLIDESFISNESQINNSLSAGIKVGYALNKKLSLQSGINIINVTSQTNNVFAKTSLKPNPISSITYEPLASLMNLSPTAPNDLILAKDEVVSSNSFEGVLNQEFGYIEVPLEVKYNLTEGKKLGLNLVGGFSTLFLNKNSIHYETEGFTTKIGEANNLNDVNFSGNLGVDVDYNINKQLYFNLSPMIKVQTNTFSSNSGNFKPYTLGVYTGLNYRF